MASHFDSNMTLEKPFTILLREKLRSIAVQLVRLTIQGFVDKHF